MIFELGLKKTPKLCIKFINQPVSIKARVHLENYHYSSKCSSMLPHYLCA